MKSDQEALFIALFCHCEVIENNLECTVVLQQGNVLHKGTTDYSWKLELGGQLTLMEKNILTP